VWNEAERKKGQAWGLKTIETFHTHGTPTMDHYKEPLPRLNVESVK
jgi:catechol 2,3-dioxygenase